MWGVRAPRIRERARKSHREQARREAEAQQKGQEREQAGGDQEDESLEDVLHWALSSVLDMTIAPFFSQQPRQQQHHEEQQHPQQQQQQQEMKNAEGMQSTPMATSGERGGDALRQAEAQFHALMGAGWSHTAAAAASAPEYMEEDAGTPLAQCPISSECGKVPCAFLVDHVVNRCPHRLVECPNEGCAQHLPVRDLPAHVASCAHAQRACTHGCGAVVALKELSLHEGECACAPVPCRFERFGCAVRVARTDMDEHLAMYLHEHMQLMATRVDRMEQSGGGGGCSPGGGAAKGCARERRGARALERAVTPVVAALDDAAQSVTVGMALITWFAFMFLRMLPTFVFAMVAGVFLKAFHSRWVRPHSRALPSKLRALSHLIYVVLMCTVLYLACKIW
eukprot:TRINITY_DN305_c6_g1_i1.p1 TRINITY_DN305_c6_g1~~TRINITY_DN305_c6_g1_i1.p1  ORF type:complete len:396 (-),score=135.10 TRINITY_DN305_c6_g1_i1:210-1397(-)